MQTATLSKALLVLVFRSARSGRRPNLTAFCRRSAVSVADLQRAFDLLEGSGLISFTPEGEQLTLQGLAVAAAWSRASRSTPRPLVACRRRLAA
jgi:hypothetical protein